MSVLRLFGGKRKQDPVSQEATEEISKDAEICDESACCGDCAEDEAELEKGDKVFSKLHIDHDKPLYNSSKAPKIHFVVPTSQTDWQHDACLENPNSVQYKVYNWCQDHADQYAAVGDGQTLSCAVSSLPKDIMDIEVMRGTKNNVLILPHFLWIKDLTSDKVDQTLDELVPTLLQKDMDREKLLKQRTDLAEAGEHSFVLICSHAKRDKRCGIVAPYLKKAFEKGLVRHGLSRDNSDFRPGGVQIAFVNHVGGHKFAANVQIFLKEPNTLIWLARVTPTNVPYIIDGIIVPEKPKLPWPEKVRCIKKYDSW